MTSDKDSTLSERQNGWASYRAGAALRSLLRLYTFWGFGVRACFLSNYPIFFLAFSGPVLVPSPYPISFLNSSGLVPFYVHHLGFCRTCLIVLLHLLASTVHALRKRNFFSPFSPSPMLIWQNILVLTTPTPPPWWL